MRAEPFEFEAEDGRKLFVHRWLPGEAVPLRGVLHVAHGMAEHAGRYARVAEALTAVGWVVYANDHRGHGKTARWSSELGYLDGGLRRCVRDIEQLIDLEKQERPGLPVVLFGHSMGSTLVQTYLIDRGGTLDAAVLSATSGKPGGLATAGRAIARLERRRLGERSRSELLTEMTFGGFNRAFRPNRTAYDWLSRDEAEVDRYIADPLCGFSCTTSLWVDLLDTLAENARPELQARVPKDLPIYLFAGTRDRVGGDTKSVKQLLGAYRAAGLRRVTPRFYEGGRHEMLNETNREEVVRELIAWLDAEVPRRG